MKITGTFVQPICNNDIPAMNWLAYPSSYLMKNMGCFEPCGRKIFLRRG